MTGSVLLETGGSVAFSAIVQSRSQTLPYPAPLSNVVLEPSAPKRSKMSSGALEVPGAPQLALLIVTDLTPLLTSSRVTCSVLLRSPFTASGPAVHLCGRVILDTKDLLQRALEPRLLTDCSVDSEELREDLLSLLAVFESWLFQIESPEHTLVDVSGWLVDRLGAKPVGVSLKYLLIKSIPLSSTMLFQWQPCGPFRGLLHVHCSGHLAVLRFLDTLCDFLPASHQVQPLKSPAPRVGSQGIAFFLERETRMIKEGMASLLHDGQEMEGQSFCDGERWDPTSLEQLHRCREAWQREEERSIRALRPLVDASKYRSLMDSLILTQQNGDIAALVEAQGSEVMELQRCFPSCRTRRSFRMRAKAIMKTHAAVRPNVFILTGSEYIPGLSAETFSSSS